MKHPLNPKTPSLFRSLFRRLGRGGMIAMLFAAAAVIVAGYLTNLPAVYLGNIVDIIATSNSTTNAWSVFALIIVFLVCRALLVVVQKFLVERVAVGVQRNVALGNVMKVLNMRVDGIQHLRVGETTMRLEKRTQGMVRALKLIFLDAIPQLAIAIPAVILSFSESYIAGWVISTVLLMNAAVTSIQVKSQKGIRIALINKTASLAGQVSELLSHLDFVRASGMARHVEQRFNKATGEMRDVEFRHHKWMMGFDAVKGLIEDFGLAMVVGIGIYQVGSDAMTPGTILTLAMLYKAAAVPLQNLHRVVDELHESALQIKAAADVIEVRDDPSISGTAKPLREIATPIVKARDLTLVRTSQEGEVHRILDGLNFEIHAGEVIGIAGTSGGGKTTLLHAMLGLLPEYEGQLRVFGQEVRDLDKGDLADAVSYAPQKPYVRHGNVRSNIAEAVVRHGRLEDGVMLKALSRASLDIGLYKTLSERGDNISPGQIQRLSMARVFAKTHARLIVLDEATSMLDGSTQADIMDELRKHAAGRALVMVAHRLDTLRWADRILVMDGGRIAQSGTYNELSSTPGTFANLLGNQSTAHQIAAE